MTPDHQRGRPRWAARRDSRSAPTRPAGVPFLPGVAADSQGAGGRRGQCCDRRHSISPQLPPLPALSPTVEPALAPPQVGSMLLSIDQAGGPMSDTQVRFGSDAIVALLTQLGVEYAALN